MVDIDIGLSYIVSLENFREALFYLYTKYLLELLELFHEHEWSYFLKIWYLSSQ